MGVYGHPIIGEENASEPRYASRPPAIGKHRARIPQRSVRKVPSCNRTGAVMVLPSHLYYVQMAPALFGRGWMGRLCFFFSSSEKRREYNASKVLNLLGSLRLCRCFDRQFRQLQFLIWSQRPAHLVIDILIYLTWELRSMGFRRSDL